MSYKNILMLVDNAKSNEACIQAAAALAEAHDAHLTGLCLTGVASTPSYLSAEIPADFLKLQHERALNRAREAGSRFERAVAGRPFASEARVVDCLYTDMASVIAVHARYADLVILGQADPKDQEATDNEVIEEVLLSSGRPVLLVPYIGTQRKVGQSVTIAWDAGREAARAVSDAMPMLERADQVTVLAVNAHSRPGNHGEEPGADIALHLARHGVKAQVHQTESADIAVSDEILSRLADEGADLLVMGAYGHGRLRELILGGVTRSILQQMTVPVLMSH